MEFYWIVFGVAAVLAAALEYANRAGKDGKANFTREFALFRNNYLIVYSLMMGERSERGPAVCRLPALARRRCRARLRAHPCAPLPAPPASRRLAAGPPRVPAVRLLRL